jgi:hypothetical protein
VKKKILSIAFLVFGIVLVCLSFILTVSACTQVDIIGGADLSTLLFVFFRQSGGIHAALSFAGLVSILISAVICFIKKKK